MWKKTTQPKERKQIPCHKCKCLLYEDSAKIVKMSWSQWAGTDFQYYCHVCAPGYYRGERDMNGAMRYWKLVPEHEVECDEKGEEIKDEGNKEE